MARPRRITTKALRRPAGLAATMLALGLTAAACGNGTTSASSTTAKTSIIPELKPNQQVSITFESYNLTRPTWTTAIDGLISQFEAAHPNIHVKPQAPSGNGVATGDYLSSVRSEILAGNAPDVAQVTFNGLSFAATGLRAKPIDELVGQAAVAANYGGTHPFAPTATALGVINGHTYAVPYVFSTPVLWINANLFKAAGLDPAKPPATWAEAKTDALAIVKKTGKGGLYLDCTTKGSGDWCFQSLVRSAGGNVMSADGKQLTFAEAPAVAAVTMAQDLVKSGATPNLSQAQAWEDFSRGGLGMLLETSALQGTFLAASAAGKWNLSAAQEPGFGATPAVPTNSGSGLSIFSTTPDKQRAAWELVKFLTSDAAYKVISTQIGYLPLRPSLTTDPNGLQAWAALHPALLQPNLDQLTRLQPWRAFPGASYQQIVDLMMSAAESAIYQGKDPASTMLAAQQQATALLPKA